MNKFICNECEHIVHSEAEEVPTMHWSDDHSCTFTKIDEKGDDDER